MDKKILNMLVLEDNPDDAELIVKELEREGFILNWKRVETEKAFKEALKEKPGLILADYKLPFFSGPEALKIQQKLNPDIPLIIVTGAVGEEQIIECMKAGATDYVLKDKLSRLNPVVKRALKEAEEHRERKKAEEALGKSEEKFRLITENTSDIITLQTFDLKASYTYVSPSIKAMSGYEPEEMLGRSAFEFIHPEDKKALIPLLKKYIGYKLKNLITGKEFTFSETIEFRCIDKSGNLRYAQSTGNIVGNQLLFVTRDITERKQAEEKFKHLNNILRAIRNVNQLITKEKDRSKLITRSCKLLVETRGYASAWIVLLDENQKPTASVQAGIGDEFAVLIERMENQVFNECSRRALKQSGVVVIDDPKSICGNCPLVGTIPGFRAFTVRLEYEERILGLLSVEIPAELAMDEKEQELFVEVADDIAFALHTIEIEKERVRMEEELRESHGKLNRLNSMLRLMCDNLPELIWTKDFQGRFMFANKSCCEDLLNARDIYEPIGKTDIFFAEREIQSHPENPNYHTFGETCTDSDRAVLETKKVIRKDESGNIKGKFVILDIIKSPFLDENGKLIGTVGCARDVTREREIENELAKHREHLEELVKERTNELEEKNNELKRLNNLFVNREFRIKELRDKVKKLEEKLENMEKD